MRHVAAAAFVSCVVAFAAPAHEVAITLTTASDATTCMTAGAIVATGEAATVRAPLQRGITTYHLDLDPASTWQIEAEVPGCWSPTMTWSAGGNTPLQLHLERSATVHGTFAADDEVFAIQGELFPVAAAGRTEVLLDGLATRCALDWPRWQCTVPASRQLDLRLHLPGSAPLYFWDLRIPAGEALPLGMRRLEKGASIAGWVEDPAGDPKAEARVSLVAVDAANTRQAQSKTNTKGFFQFTGVAAGTYRIVSEAPGLSPARTSDIRVGAGDSIAWPVAIEHVDKPSLLLLLQPHTDREGKPWRAQISERDPFFPGRQERPRQQAAENGRIALHDLHATAYEIEIRDAGGSVVHIAEVDLSRGGEQTLPIEIRAIVATGTLRCGDEPLEGELAFTDVDGRAIRTKTDGEGRFEVAFPSPGSWETELRSPLAARASAIALDPVEIAADTTSLALQVPGGRIKGQVTSSSGAPEQAAVHVRSRQRIVAQAVTHPDGTFDLIGIPEGAYVVDAQGRSGSTRNDATLTIEKDETETVHLRLEAAQWIRGKIRTPSGAPASGATVRISADGGTRWLRTIADAHGKFEHDLGGSTGEVQLIILTYSYPAVTLRTRPTTTAPLEITLTPAGGILRVEGAPNPIVQTMGFGVPLRFLYFPEPFGQHGGGVHLPAGTYVVCPSRDPAASCKSATIAPAAETTVSFATADEKETP